MNDAFGDEDLTPQRPYPPAMDSRDDDEGFGAYDYDVILDDYDREDMRQQERLVVFDSNNVTASTPADNLSGLDEARDSTGAASGESVHDATRPRSWPRTSSPSSSARPSPAFLVPVSTPIILESAPRSPPIQSRATPIADPVSSRDVPDERPSVTPARKGVAWDADLKVSTPFSVQPTHFHAAGQTPASLSEPAWDSFLSKASYGTGVTTSLDVLEAELQELTESIYQQNNGKKFNINATKQVANVLFGPMGGSTSRDVLDGMAAAGNRLAALILDYRVLKHKISKLSRRRESVAKGTAVRSASTVARAQPQTNIENEDDPTETITLHNEMADPLLLLDASAFIFRAYYSMPAIHRGDGMPTGAVMGFCKMLNSMLLGRMLDGEQPRLVLCFDAKGKTFRHDLYKEYKGNRAAAPMDLVPQFGLVRQAAQAYGICQIDALNFEADDVIATLATMAVAEGVDANILSGDKDLMQLVTDLEVTPSIQIIDPMKKDRTTYLQVVEKWEVPPDKLGDVLALAGDSADNIPGVRGIGPKTAAKLIIEFGSLDDLLDNIDKVKQQGWREKLEEHKANARLSRILVELNRTVPLNMLTGLPDGVHQKISDLRMEPIDPDRILAFYDQMGFRELKRSFEYRLKGVKAKRQASRYKKREKAEIPKPEDYAGVPF